MHYRRITVFLLLFFVCVASLCHAENLEDGAVTPAPSPVPTAAPVENNDFSIDVALGYEGIIVLNRWMPVSVTVTNNGPDFDGWIGVNVFQTEVNYDRYEAPLTLASGATKTIQIPIKPRTRQDMYAFELTKDHKIIAETRVKPQRLIPPETVCVGVLSQDPTRLTYFTQQANGLNTLRGELWATVPLGEESFPATNELMNAFSLLVIDGVDVSALSAKNKDVLIDWLSKGGVALVSGGAKASLGYPFFEQWTGVSAAKIKHVEDITPELIRYIAAVGDPLDEKMWINSIPIEKSLIATEEDGLLSLARVGDGIVYLAAFDIGGKAFSAWQTASAFWPRMLRTSMPSFYARMLETKDQYNYGGDNYRILDLVQSAKVQNSENGVSVILLFSAYVLLCGIAGYFLLKRFDKTEWMWALTPVCAIAFALVLLLMSNQTTLNLPVALSTSQITVTGDVAHMKTYVSVATKNGDELTVETDQDDLPVVIRMDDYYYDSGLSSTRLFRPTNLIQRYQYGDRPSIAFASNEAWNPRTIEVSPNVRNESIVVGSLWIEEDGVHGEVINQTESLLSGCSVITPFGYQVLGDILPGQRAEVLLLPPDKPVQYGTQNFVFEPGVLYAMLDDMGAQTPSTRSISSAMTWDYLQSMTYDAVNGKYRSPELELQSKMISLFEQSYMLYQNTTNSYFFGFSDELGQIAVAIDQVPVTRVAHQSIIGYKIPFLPVGPTGIVMYPQGFLRPDLIVDMGDDEKPRDPTQTDGSGNNDNQYYTTDLYVRIGVPVALRFTLPDYPGINIERLSIGVPYFDSVPDFYLYNHQTEKWDKQKLLTVSLTGDECLPYIDSDGVLYARYAPTDSSGRYDSMMMPWISLKGKVK